MFVVGRFVDLMVRDKSCYYGLLVVCIYPHIQDNGLEKFGSSSNKGYGDALTGALTSSLTLLGYCTMVSSPYNPNTCVTSWDTAANYVP